MKRLFNILLAGTFLATGLVACEKSVEDVHYVPYCLQELFWLRVL